MERASNRKGHRIEREVYCKGASFETGAPVNANPKILIGKLQIITGNVRIKRNSN